MTRPLPPHRDGYRLTDRGRDLGALAASLLLAAFGLGLAGAMLGWW